MLSIEYLLNALSEQGPNHRELLGANCDPFRIKVDATPESHERIEAEGTGRVLGRNVPRGSR